ncbi:hypothetical protein JHK85_006072 [Glycine max]|nr:hypothetical protein JHK85_006072 [Glycine max]KAG5081848.1 hypothetical protein JHK86_005913 [Glycine max]
MGGGEREKEIMSSMGESQQRSLFGSTKASSLPVSTSRSDSEGGLRRRLSSLSLKIQLESPNSSSWSFPRSKSLSSMGDYARTWWDWSWAWILSRKLIFATDLEMNDQETKLLASHNRGTWRHVFYKLRSEIRRFINTSDHTTLPKTYHHKSTPQVFS